MNPAKYGMSNFILVLILISVSWTETLDYALDIKQKRKKHFQASSWLIQQQQQGAL